MIVIVGLRYCERTRSYTDRRLADGNIKKKPSAASSASSPESSTAHSEATSPPSQPALDIYRNVPGRFTARHNAPLQRHRRHADIAASRAATPTVTLGNFVYPRACQTLPGCAGERPARRLR